jgi:hypothetical protein
MEQNYVVKAHSSEGVSSKIVILNREYGFTLVGEIQRGLDSTEFDVENNPVIKQNWFAVLVRTVDPETIRYFTIVEMGEAVDQGFALGVESINPPVPPAEPSTPKEEWLAEKLAEKTGV